MTVWKYVLKIQDEQKVPMPRGAKVLHVGNQGSSLCVWASVDSPWGTDEQIFEDRIFYVHGTGHQIRGTKHLGTVQIGSFVWHVFE